MFQIEITDDADFFYVNVITNVYCMLNSMSVLMLINMICYFMCSFFKVSALFLSHYFESMNKSRERCSSLKLKSCHNFKFRPSKNFYSKAENFCFKNVSKSFFFTTTEGMVRPHEVNWYWKCNFVPPSPPPPPSLPNRLGRHCNNILLCNLDRESEWVSERKGGREGCRHM